MGVGPVGPVPSPQPWQKQKPYPGNPMPGYSGGGMGAGNPMPGYSGGQPAGVDVASGWRSDVSPGGGMPIGDGVALSARLGMPAQMPPQSSFAMPPGLQGLSMAEVSKDGMASPYGGGLGAMPEGLQKIAALRQLQQFGGPQRLPPVRGQRKF